jgi:predicted TIM-barrel fold metal-dependent hydrolase
VRALVTEIVDRFGPSRCMFGSNFPVDRLFIEPARLRDCFDDAIDGYAASDRAELLAGTATRIYRLDTIQHEER